MPRKTRGCKKMKMEKISNDSNQQVTFSKHKTGIFKKASELSTLCGAETAVIVFSPRQKVFSFGHPSVEMVIDCYVNRNPPPTSSCFQLIEAHRNARIDQLNMQLNQVSDESEMENKRGEDLDRIMKASQTQCWWEAPIEELDLSQLEDLKVALEDLRSKVARQAEQLLPVQILLRFQLPVQILLSVSHQTLLVGFLILSQRTVGSTPTRLMDKIMLDIHYSRFD